MQRLYCKTFIPGEISVIWDFFSSPRNLAKITPEKLALIIKNPDLVPPKMYPGLIIIYTVSPLPFFKTEWVTEITHVKEGEFFVDEQRAGPYTFWHHQHVFKKVDGGVEMEDIIHYKLPAGPLGQLLLGSKVKSDLKEIFDFRFIQMQKFFPGTVSLN